MRHLRDSGRLAKYRQEARDRQARRAPGIATDGDKHSGELAVVLAKEEFKNLGREVVRHLVHLVDAEVGSGKLLNDIEPTRRAEFERIVTAALDGVARGAWGIPTALAGVQRQRRDFLSEEARAAIIAEENRKAAEQARERAHDPDAEYVGLLRALTAHPGLSEGASVEHREEFVEAFPAMLAAQLPRFAAVKPPRLAWVLVRAALYNSTPPESRGTQFPQAGELDHKAAA
jgi:hypothetical protein